VKPFMLLLVAFTLVGCGSAETRPDDPIVVTQPQDAPSAEERASPPLGKPRAKVSPLTVDKRSESLFTDDPPH